LNPFWFHESFSDFGGFCDEDESKVSTKVCQLCGSRASERARCIYVVKYLLDLNFIGHMRMNRAKTLLLLSIAFRLNIIFRLTIVFTLDWSRYHDLFIS